ncbi:hypothetical protein BD413DRAFT_611546 [Trametes elegans]|nr:hypothetical protein BD413DRAFT_611546 [Trametes elegans]
MPRRRKQPSRAARSPSRDPPPRDAVLQRSRYFTKPSGSTIGAGTDANDANDAGGNTGRVRVDSGDVHAMQDLARAIGLSPPRAPPSTAEDEEGEENPFAPDAKGKQKAAPAFGEQNSDYDFEFDVDDSFLEQVARAEQEALRASGPSAPTTAAATSDQTQTLIQAQAQVKAEDQSESRSLFSMATSATAVGTQRSTGRGRGASCTPAPGSRAPSAPGTSSSGAGMDMDVIDISDDEVEDDKENVPVRARHVRARYDVIELSD